MNNDKTLTEEDFKDFHIFPRLKEKTTKHDPECYISTNFLSQKRKKSSSESK